MKNSSIIASVLCFVVALGVWGCGHGHEASSDAASEADASTPDAALDIDAGPGHMPDAASTVRDSGSSPHDSGNDAFIGHDAGTAVADFERDYCGALSMSLCRAASTCMCPPSSTLPADMTACVAGLRAECDSSVIPDVTTALGSGAAVLDLDKLHACTAAFDRAVAACEVVSQDTLYACERAVAAPVGATSCDTTFCAGGDGTCVDDGSGSPFCSPLPAAGESCDFACQGTLACIEGICVAPRSMDAACDTTEQCDPPLHCIAGHCAAAHALGGACASAGDCHIGLACVEHSCAAGPTDCVSDGECLAGTSCQGTRDLRCAAPGEIGATCAGFGSCVDTAYCDETTLHCLALPTASASCGNFYLCASDLTCDDTTHCIPLPGMGEACVGGPILGGGGGPGGGGGGGDPPPVMGAGCASGLGCVMGTCQPLPVEGAPCTDFGECAAGLTCDYSLPTPACAPPIGEGGSCSFGGNCAAGLFCDPFAAICSPRHLAGEACAGFDDCADGSHCSALDPTSAGTCIADPGVGDACPDDICGVGLYCQELVLDGHCVSGVCTLSDMSSRGGGGGPGVPPGGGGSSGGSSGGTPLPPPPPR